MEEHGRSARPSAAGPAAASRHFPRRRSRSTRRRPCPRKFLLVVPQELRAARALLLLRRRSDAAAVASAKSSVASRRAFCAAARSAAAASAAAVGRASRRSGTPCGRPSCCGARCGPPVHPEVQSGRRRLLLHDDARLRQRRARRAPRAARSSNVAWTSMGGAANGVAFDGVDSDAVGGVYGAAAVDRTAPAAVDCTAPAPASPAWLMTPSPPRRQRRHLGLRPRQRCHAVSVALGSPANEVVLDNLERELRHIRVALVARGVRVSVYIHPWRYSGAAIMVSPGAFWSSGAGSCVSAAPFFSSGTIDFDDANIVEVGGIPVARGPLPALRSTTLATFSFRTRRYSRPRK